MIVIIGHGPSILSGLGAVIDECTVVRLKHGRIEDNENWGARTDYLCGRSPRHTEGHPGVPFWHFGDYGWVEKWLGYFHSFSPSYPTDFGPIMPKPSHGLCAAFAVMEYLKPEAIAFIGCDRLLRPDEETWKWNTGPTCFPHDWHAEHEALHSLGIRIIDLAKEHGQIHRLQPVERHGNVG